MVTEVTTDDTDSWSLKFIYERADEQIELCRFNEARKLCVHGQSEATKKNSKEWGLKFDDLYNRIDNLFKAKQEKIMEKTKSDQVDISDNIEGDGVLTLIKGVGSTTAEILNNEGITTIKQLAECSLAMLTEFKGIGPKTAEKIILNAKNYLESEDKKLEYLSIQDFAETPPVRNELEDNNYESETRNTEIPEPSIPFRENIIKEEIGENINNVPNFDRLNDNKQNQIEHSSINEQVNEKDDNEDDFNINKIKRRFMSDSVEKYNSPIVSEVKTSSNQDSHVNVIGDDVDNYVLEYNMQVNEYLDKRIVQSMVANIEEVLKRQGFLSILKSTGSSIEQIFNYIDIIGFKRIKISEGHEQIIIIPIRVCNLKGRLILSETIHDYKSLQQESIEEKKRELFINSNIGIHRKIQENIFLDIIEKGFLFKSIKNRCKIDNLIVEKTKSNRPLFLRSGGVQYKVSINPILVCKESPAFEEISIRFPYIRSENLHVIEELQVQNLVEFIEAKHLHIDTYEERPNLVKEYANSRDKFINDLRLVSVPFILYGFVFFFIIIFQANFLINAFIILTIGVFALYWLIFGYLYIKFNREKQLIIEEFNTPEYLRPVNLDETDLLIIKNELSTELLKQFIFECFGKNSGIKIAPEIVTQIEQMDDLNRTHAQNTPFRSYEEVQEEDYVLGSTKKDTKKNKKSHTHSKYMSLLED